MAHLAIYAAGAVVAGMYLNAKTGLMEDLRVQNANRSYSSRMASDVKKGRLSLFSVLEHNYKTIPSAPSIYNAENAYQETWSDTYHSVVRFAHFAKSKGVNQGDVVAVFYSNKPAILHIWLAMAALGAVPAFINYNLYGDPLLHCIKVSKANLVFVDESVKPQLDPLEQSLVQLGVESVVLDMDLQRSIAQLPAQSPMFDPSTNKPTDLSTIFFTSGTTGFPKPAAFALFRWYGVAFVIGDYLRLKPQDRFYTCMPLYHGSGSSCFIMCLFRGACFCLGKKFSVSRFWQEVKASQATMINYVGETCRYLLNAPSGPSDKAHRVHTAYGNGLRSDVWQAFRDRFGISNILEFYGSSEGMGSTLNYNSGPCGVGAVGRDGLLQRALKRNSLVTIAIDELTMEPIRKRSGLCQQVSSNQPGELLMNIPSLEWFAGYYGNPEATNKKILEDVLSHGDHWFRSGDLLRRTDDGYWYFVDRLGETFRWKSENVSTMEVAEVLSKHPCISEALVYGVHVPHHEGKAGCAALLLSPNAQLSVEEFAHFATTYLPKYAVPVFLRIIQDVYRTENNKQLKAPLIRQGINPELVPATDPMYMLDSRGGSGKGDSSSVYVPYTPEEWKLLESAQLSL